MSRRPRIYCPSPLAEGAVVTLPETAARHLRKALRLGPGDPVRIFDGAGREHEAQLIEGGPGIRARIGASLTPLAESDLGITLIQGISRGERMDWAIQKATELGLARIVPVQTARSVVRLDGERARRRRRHWQAVAASACEQCGRSVVPEVSSPRTLAGALADGFADAGAGSAGLRLMLDSAGPGIRSLRPPESGSVSLLIGPEGGLAPDEKALASRHGFIPLGLGPRVLRTETAAMVAVAVCQLMWGDLSASQK